MAGPARRLLTAFLSLAALACGGPSRGTDTSARPSLPAIELVRQSAIPLTGTAADYDSLMALVGDAQVVLLGESTHGTHEFYRERARITQRLIAEKGFTAVAIEGDWPDAYRVNRYVRGIGGDASAEQALSSFTRFPRWMWRNAEIRDLVRWMREHNAPRSAAERVGFYGLDVYSLYPSIDAVIAYLDGVDPAVAARARTAYGCFARWRPSASAYGAATASGTSCENQAREVLREMEQRAATRPSDPEAAEALFSALRDAHSVANAESYFRTAYRGGMSTWNLRDQRMAEGLAALQQHLAAATGRQPKVVVWAHNTHTGDARATEMGAAGELNIGELVRRQHGDDAVLVGFFTYTGEVYASSEWDEPGRVQTVRPALPESYSGLFHETGMRDFLLILRGSGALAAELGTPRLERAIGVIYLPRTERQSHYFTAQLAEQFDAAVFFDRTRAVTPLR